MKKSIVILMFGLTSIFLALGFCSAYAAVTVTVINNGAYSLKVHYTNTSSKADATRWLIAGARQEINVVKPVNPQAPFRLYGEVKLGSHRTVPLYRGKGDSVQICTFFGTSLKPRGHCIPVGPNNQKIKKN